MRYSKKEQTETPYEVFAYKLEPGEDFVHSVHIRDDLFEVQGIFIHAADHYAAFRIYMEKYKKDIDEK